MTYWETKRWTSLGEHASSYNKHDIKIGLLFFWAPPVRRRRGESCNSLGLGRGEARSTEDKQNGTNLARTQQRQTGAIPSSGCSLGDNPSWTECDDAMQVGWVPAPKHKRGGGRSKSLCVEHLWTALLCAAPEAELQCPSPQ